jgi:hypothetical protein
MFGLYPMFTNGVTNMRAKPAIWIKTLPNFVIAIIMTSGALISYIFIKIYPTEMLICRYNCKE